MKLQNHFKWVVFCFDEFKYKENKMAVNKVKKIFGCSECGTEFPRWQGQCSGCKAWNSISELRVSSSPQVTRNDKLSGFSGMLESKIRKLSEIEIEELPRLDSSFGDLNRV